MDIYKSEWTRLQEEIFRLLCFKAGEKLTQREISLSLGVSPTAVGKSLESLKKENLISIEKNRSMNLVFLNREESRVIELKRVENMRNVYTSGLVDELKGVFPGRAIILFGSYSKGEDNFKSDIDIAVIGLGAKKIDLNLFNKKLGRKIIINHYNSFKDIHSNLKSNILSGILLSGVIEL